MISEQERNALIRTLLLEVNGKDDDYVAMLSVGDVRKCIELIEPGATLPSIADEIFRPPQPLFIKP